MLQGPLQNYLHRGRRNVIGPDAVKNNWCWDRDIITKH